MLIKARETFYSMKAVPNGLKNWFIVHIVADLLFGIPLFLFPTKFLSYLYWSWSPIDPLASRIVGAALIAIAVLSYYCNRSNNVEVFRVALKFKSVWGSLAFLATAYAAFAGGSPFVWFGALVFLVFAIVWNWYRTRL